MYPDDYIKYRDEFMIKAINYLRTCDDDKLDEIFSYDNINGYFVSFPYNGVNTLLFMFRKSDKKYEEFMNLIFVEIRCRVLRKILYNK